VHASGGTQRLSIGTCWQPPAVQTSSVHEKPSSQPPPAQSACGSVVLVGSEGSVTVVVVSGSGSVVVGSGTTMVEVVRGRVSEVVETRPRVVVGSGGSVTVTVPASGFVYLNVHLDYGPKGTTGYTKGGTLNNDAVSCTNTAAVLIPDMQNYAFSLGGTISGSSTISSCNAFKKNPGVGGLLTSTTTTYEVPGAAAVLKDAKGAALVNALTDEDGWYILSYKYTGKATTFYVTVTPPGKPAQTQTITLKANGYVEADFTTP